MRTIVSAVPGSDRAFMSTLLKPAVLGVIDWKRAESSCFGRENPLNEKFLSNRKNSSAPPKINVPVVIRTSFV